MRILLQFVSLIALLATVVPSMIYCAGGMALEMVKWIMLLATIVWFAVTPFWMNRKQEE